MKNNWPWYIDLGWAFMPISGGDIFFTILTFLTLGIVVGLVALVLNAISWAIGKFVNGLQNLLVKEWPAAAYNLACGAVFVYIGINATTWGYRHGGLAILLYQVVAFAVVATVYRKLEEWYRVGELWESLRDIAKGTVKWTLIIISIVVCYLAVLALTALYALGYIH